MTAIAVGPALATFPSATRREAASGSTAPSEVPAGATRASSALIEPSGIAVSVGELRVRLVYELGEWVALEDVTGLYGEGDSPRRAFNELLGALADLRHDLQLYSGHLADPFERQLGALNRTFGA
jgi:hypothetical protein